LTSKKQGTEQSEAVHRALKYILTLSQSLSNPSHDEGRKVLAASPLWAMETKEHSENGRTLADSPLKPSEMAFILSGRQRPNNLNKDQHLDHESRTGGKTQLITSKPVQPSFPPGVWMREDGRRLQFRQRDAKGINIEARSAEAPLLSMERGSKPLYLRMRDQRPTGFALLRPRFKLPRRGKVGRTWSRLLSRRAGIFHRMQG
jgi:hypothetical protein